MMGGEAYLRGQLSSLRSAERYGGQKSYEAVAEPALGDNVREKRWWTGREEESKS